MKVERTHSDNPKRRFNLNVESLLLRAAMESFSSIFFLNYKEVVSKNFPTQQRLVGYRKGTFVE